MQTAHDLARYAAMCADYMPLDEIESWHIEKGLIGDVDRVTFRLTNGKRKTYSVYEEKEADTPTGESGPSSPRE